MAQASMEPTSDSHFTVFIRLPFNRGHFVDPPPVAWTVAKERRLWDVISRPSTKGNEIDWDSLAETLNVSQAFLLQQAAWLYERQLSQVRAQMRRVGAAVHSASPSPGPGSNSGSGVGGIAMRRVRSGGSRVPSRLSTREARENPPTKNDTSAPTTPVKNRPQTQRIPSTGNVPAILGRRGSTDEAVRRSQKVPSRPASKESLETKPASRQRNSLLSERKVPLEKPRAESSEEDSDGEDAVSARRPSFRRKGASKPQLKTSKIGDRADSDSDDSPTFLPFATSPGRGSESVSRFQTESPSATLRGMNDQHARPPSNRRGTMERIPQPNDQPQLQSCPRLQSQPSAATDTTSISSMSESFTSSGAPRSESPSQSQSQSQSQPSPANPLRGPLGLRSAGPLSPQRAAELARAGLSPSPRRRGHGAAVRRDGHVSDGTGTPSIGSSFSDLDDASVTRSALEEALLSNMQNGQQGNGNGNIASRMSSISQALRSRYLS